MNPERATLPTAYWRWADQFALSDSAKLLGVYMLTSDIRCNHVDPTIGKLRAIASALGWSLSTLVDVHDELRHSGLLQQFTEFYGAFYSVDVPESS